jgi:hypothetical protein
MLYRARYYNPSVGRFVSEDPIRFRSAKNFYPYVLNSPIETIDPLGLIATTTGCCDDKKKQIEDAAHKACKDSKNGGCRQVLNKYNLSRCIDDKCKKPIPFRCWGNDPTKPDWCAEVERNGGSGGGGVIRIYPNALSGFPTTTGCGNLSGTIVHELAHLCDIGPDFPPADYPETYYKAKNIQAACDDDPSTIGN